MAAETAENKWKSRLNFAARLIAVLILGAFLVLSDEQRSAIARVLSDPISIFAARSPGERGNAALRQTKIRKQFVKADIAKLLDRQEVLGPEEFFAPEDAFAEVGAVPAADDPAPGADAGPVEVATADTPPSGNHPWTGGNDFHVVPGGDITGGGGGGGGKGGNCPEGSECATPTSDPGTPIVAIPEPATWLLLLVGFFSLGALLRYARRSFGRDARPRVD